MSDGAIHLGATARRERPEGTPKRVAGGCRLSLSLGIRLRCPPGIDGPVEL
jgi:hypothetical protein